MSKRKRAGLLGVAVGAVATGVAAGMSLERLAVGRKRLRPDPEAREAFGRLPGKPRVVTLPDGVRLYVEETGSGPLTVVFVHGFALSMTSFHYQRRDLADVGRLVFVDQRAHGRSQRGDDENCTLDQVGLDLLAVLDEVAPNGPIVLVGHSMGGMTVMALADQQPQLFGDRVVGVALVSTSPGRLAEVTFGVPAAAGRVLRRAAPRALAALNRRPGLVARGRHLGSDIEFVLTKRYSFATDVPPSLVQFVQRMHDQTPLDVLAELFPAFDAHDKLDALQVLNGVETL
ncbi:MAG TPA: alpha/beta hydrolase, partial [Frankiaceae bacterium]|nr:alpha/beta hydrolase [Frankiaceae bacterium]